jgi:hypothetical protein
MPKIIQYTCNTPIKNPLGFKTYFKSPRGVLHGLNKNLEGTQYLHENICKQYGLNYFNPSHQRSIACAHNYSMVFNTSLRVYEKSFGLHHIFIETWKGIA